LVRNVNGAQRLGKLATDVWAALRAEIRLKALYGFDGLNGFVGLPRNCAFFFVKQRHYAVAQFKTEKKALFRLSARSVQSVESG